VTENNLKPKEPRKVCMTFIDLDVRGKWASVYDKHHLSSQGDGDEIWLVSTDGLKRGWIMSKGTRIKIIGSTLSLNPAHIIKEISIDEKEQSNCFLTKSWY
jgi:hypothetical protein